MFVKWSSFATPKIELLLSNNIFFAYEFTCHGCGANCVGKTKRMLYEQCVEHAWSDQSSIVKNHNVISVLKCSTYLKVTSTKIQ